MGQVILVGEVAEVDFLVRSGSGAGEVPLPGLAQTDFSLELRRRVGSNPYEPTTELVTIVEHGEGGYCAQFAPNDDGAGHTYWLELAVVSTSPPAPGFEYVRQDFFWHAGSADELPRSFTEADAFCALQDVVAAHGTGPFSPEAPPSSDDVLLFMALRAAEVEARLALAGFPRTVPSGPEPFDDTTDSVARLARLANATGAAADVAAIYQVRESGGPEDRLALLTQRYDSALDQLRKLTVGTKTRGGLRTHLATGGVAKGRRGTRSELDDTELFTARQAW